MKWVLKNKSQYENPYKNEFCEEIILEYVEEDDLLELTLIRFDNDKEKMTMYPKDVPIIHKLLGKAMNEAKNAGWWENINKK